jgi:hypothetical protein
MVNARFVMLGVALFLAPITVSIVAHAQDAATVAEGLFREGVALLQKGELGPACQKLAESQRLDPSAGTLLNLADCHEKRGKIATAWSEFLSAARLAKHQSRPDAASEASRRAGLLEPKVSHLEIVLSQKIPGTTVEVDKVTLEASALGSLIPVDPGEHVVVISAPGYEPLSMKVQIGADHDRQTLTVPGLQRQAVSKNGRAAEPRPKTLPPDRGGEKPSPPIVGYVLGGAGIAAVATGGVFALLAKSAYSDAESDCPSHSDCSQHAIDLYDRAKLRANVANVGIGVGLVAVAVGTYLVVSAGGSEHGEKRAAKLSLAPVVTPNGAELWLQGAAF